MKKYWPLVKSEIFVISREKWFRGHVLVWGQNVFPFFFSGEVWSVVQYGNLVLKNTCFLRGVLWARFKLHGIFHVLYGLVSTLKNSRTFGYRFTIVFSDTVIPQLLYSYFTAWLATDRHPEPWAGPPAPGCPFPCFSTDSVNSWPEKLPPRPWPLIRRHFPRGLCSNRINIKCVAASIYPKDQ